MKITIKKLGQYPWLEGTVEGHHFQAAVYDEPSVYGINEGRISKLMVWDEAKRQGRRSYSRTTLMNYDRGWDIEPEARHKALIDELVSYLENCRHTKIKELRPSPMRAVVFCCPSGGKQISTSGAAGSGRGLSREKSRFQVGYIPHNFKERRWRPWQTATEALVSALDRRKRRCRISWSRAIRGNGN